MDAIVAPRYGSPEILAFEQRAEPTVRAGAILVEVWATSVTTADWRMRSGDFGGGLALLGRLAIGVTRPRQRTTGREYAGRVIAVGAGVTAFAVGDDVFGTTSGANAEVIEVSAAGVVAHIPAGLSHAEAAALPFGAITALEFLEGRAQVGQGERVLVVGASGGVGVYLVQVAKACGAHVTAVCSGDNDAFVRALGADDVIDYGTTDLRTLRGTYDVVVDTIGKTSFRDVRSLLSESGRHVFIEGGLRELVQSVTTRFRSGPRVISGVALDTRDALHAVVASIEQGRLRPVVGRRFPMRDVVEAHRLVESRHRQGAVILDFPRASPDAGNSILAN